MVLAKDKSKRTDDYGNHFRYRAKVKDARGEQQAGNESDQRMRQASIGAGMVRLQVSCT